jgi:hypothetical protein
MKDVLVHLEKLRTEAAEYTVISNSTDDPEKRQLFAMMAQHLTVLADAVQREVDKGSSQAGSGT